MGKPRYAARVDDTHPAIREALIMAGARILTLDVSECGAPDLLVGWLGTLTLLEIKRRGGKLSEEQTAWHAWWAGAGIKVATVRSPREALEACGIVGAAVEDRRASMAKLASALKVARRGLPPNILARLRPSRVG